MATYIPAMATTIQISKELLEALKKRKLYTKESYEEVIWDLLEDTMELSEETLRNIEESKRDIREGRVYTHEQIKKELGLFAQEYITEASWNSCSLCQNEYGHRKTTFEYQEHW